MSLDASLRRFRAWLKANTNKWLESPRKDVFKTDAQQFKIVETAEEFMTIKFRNIGTQGREHFWRFETVLDLLRKEPGKYIRLGTSIPRTDDQDTIKYWIQQAAFERNPNWRSDLKCTPHICDLLVLAGLAEYGRQTNPKTGRRNQAIRLR